MAILNKCCFCCTLRTGGVVYGWIGLVAYAVNLVVVIALLANFKPPENKEFTDEEEKEEEDPFAYENTKEYMAGEIVVLFLHAIACGLLIVGAMKGNRFFLLPWLTLQGISIVLLVLGIVIVSIVFQTSGTNGILVLCIGTLIMVVPCYLWLCIYSLYQELRDNRLVTTCAPVTQEVLPPNQNESYPHHLMA